LLDSPVVGAVNIASGKPVSLKEIICKIAEQLNSSGLIELGSIPTAATDPPLLVADVRRLKDEVSWRASYDLDEGIEQTILWWKAHLATVC
jgi:nucleoside-diphosphate-sugar epimerase